MVVLLDCNITVADGAVCDRVHMVRIVESIMAVIMTHRGHHDREGVKVSQCPELSEFTLRQDQVSHLEDVSSVHSVVILDLCIVALANFLKEPWQDFTVYLLDTIKLQLVHDVDGDHREGTLGPKLRKQIMRVESVRINAN